MIFFLFGKWNKVYHYNGKTIMKYPELESYDHLGIAMKGDLVCTAGAFGYSPIAVVVRGIRAH